MGRDGVGEGPALCDPGPVTQRLWRDPKMLPPPQNPAPPAQRGSPVPITRARGWGFAICWGKGLPSTLYTFFVYLLQLPAN